MGLKDIFKSTKERKKEQRKAKREKERTVERVIDRFRDRVKELEKEQKKIWEKARMLLQNGQKAEATRLLQTYKSQSVMISRYEKQKLFAQNQLDIITGASDMAAVTAGLGELAKIQNFTPDEIADNLDDLDMVAGDIKDINNVMDKAFEKDQERLAAEADDLSEISIDDDLMSALENEAAAGILGDKVVENNTTKNSQETTADINAGKNRLNAILNAK